MQRWSTNHKCSIRNHDNYFHIYSIHDHIYHLPLTSVKNLAYNNESLRLFIDAILAKVPKVTKMNKIEKKNLVMYENEVWGGVWVGWSTVFYSRSCCYGDKYSGFGGCEQGLDFLGFVWGDFYLFVFFLAQVLGNVFLNLGFWLTD